MPNPDYQDLVAAAEGAVQYAQDVREHHRFRTKRGNAKRETDIKIALKRLRGAMEPLRSAIGRIQFEPGSQTKERKQDRLRKASQDIQRERRKLWKMQDR